MFKKRPASFTVNVLFKKEGGEWVGHCLELDIVSTDTNLKRLKTDMKNLIIAQVEFAFSNDNLDYLFHPAPPDVWAEFYKCKKMDEEKFSLPSPKKAFVPPWIIANMCKTESSSHV